MVYRAIGIMSGSSLDGLDIVFVEFHENGGKWSYEIGAAACYPYPAGWTEKLRTAASLSALDYMLLHTAYGHYLGGEVNRFIGENGLQYKVALVASHGHTVFHLPAKKMTAQLGDGAAIAAETKLPVVSDLRALDVALGGQGAPIVPVGEKLLFEGYDYYLNLGGIANMSFNRAAYVAFDVCPANRVLNMLANDAGKAYDESGTMASAGQLNEALLQQLNGLGYYQQSYPKSLANDFGTDVIYPLIKKTGSSVPDALRTYVEHIAVQVSHATGDLSGGRLLVTGGGAFNHFLTQRIIYHLNDRSIEVIIPDEKTIQYKEALIMALLGVLRWREEDTVFPSVTGASGGSVGGAMWMGQEE